jgi:tRNA threonylcarbamoyladenosine biosynthesis protein TsaB
VALILNIDCATNFASVCISNKEQIISFSENKEQREHASFLQLAIKEIAAQAGIALQELDAVAVTSGPGSYTGLRVGMASAKGICYALNKPLILINTLEVMTQSMMTAPAVKNKITTDTLFCPMIDARRMEVFTALYDFHQKTILPPTALEVKPSCFDTFLEKNFIFFFGDGSTKCQQVINNENALFFDNQYSAKNLAMLASAAFQNNLFASLAYAEPLYAKEFHFVANKKSS